MQIKDDPALAWLGRLKVDPNKRLRNKYYRFHRDHGHDTSICYDLKQQIEALIRQEKFATVCRARKGERKSTKGLKAESMS